MTDGLGGMSLEQGAVAALCIFGIGTLLWLRGLNTKVEGAAAKDDVAELKRQMQANWTDTDKQDDKTRALEARCAAYDQRFSDLERRIEGVAKNTHDSREMFGIAKGFRELSSELSQELRALKEQK